MGWNNGGAYRSATAMHELGQHVAHVVSASDWRTVQPLFHSAQWADGPFTLTARAAGSIARVFRTAAAHQLMPGYWADSARELAAVAEQHAATGRAWRWS